MRATVVIRALCRGRYVLAGDDDAMRGGAHKPSPFPYECAARALGLKVGDVEGEGWGVGELIGPKVDVSGEFIAEFELVFVQEP